MNVTIKGPNGPASIYSLRDLYKSARAVAKMDGSRYVRHWVEVAGDTVRLRVEVKLTDGRGNILGIAL